MPGMLDGRTALITGSGSGMGRSHARLMAERGARVIVHDGDAEGAGATARLVRDAHVGVLWEGTSSMKALDVTTRASAKLGAHEALGSALQDRLDDCDALGGQYRGELSGMAGRAVSFAAQIAAKPEHEPLARQASNALYHAMSAVLMALEGAVLSANGGDARRMLLSRMVIEHHLSARDPLSVGDFSLEPQFADLLLDDRPVTHDQAVRLLSA